MRVRMLVLTLTLTLWITTQGTAQEMPPIEQGIATAVALRGLTIQETPTSPPPTDPIETMAQLNGTPTDAQWDRMAPRKLGYR